MTLDPRDTDPMHGAEGGSATWDAGELGCARFVLELRRRMDALAPGQCLELVARDAGIANDIAAWCRMTGHRLLSAAPPRFTLQCRAGRTPCR